MTTALEKRTIQIIFIITIFSMLSRSSARYGTQDAVNRSKDFLPMLKPNDPGRFYWSEFQTVFDSSKIIGLEDIFVWRPLIWTTGGVIRTQTSVRGYDTQFDVNVILFQSSMWRTVADIESTLNGPNAWTKVVYVDVTESSVDSTLHLLSPHDTSARNVIVVCDRISFVVDLLARLVASQEFRWTALIHIAEWILISNCELENALTNIKTPDFITYVCSPEPSIVSVAQKERNSGLERIARFNFSPVHSCEVIEISKPDTTRDVRTTYILSQEQKIMRKGKQQKYERKNNVHLDENAQDPIPILSTSNNKMADVVQEQLGKIRKFRKHASLYLRTKKSLLDGLDLKVSMFLSESEPVQLLYEKTENNLTKYDGFLVRFVNVLAQNLGFTYEISLVQDGGYFGKETSNRTITGILGQLARRETAFTMIPISMNSRRLQLVDYIVCAMGRDQAKFVYKHQEADVLDTMFVDIVQTDLVLFLLGPLCLMALVGGIVHVVTRSCTSATTQPCSVSALWGLHSYPEHFCFETNFYPSQSGRILKASWGVTWLILSSMYSAYLTSTFAVRSEEIRIRSLQDLTNAVGYRVGVNGRMSSLIASLETSAEGTVDRKLYNMLQDFNSTDPMTFSDNVTYHMNRVLEGKYVFVTFSPFNDILLDTTEPDDPLVQSEQFQSPRTYIGVPFNVFYKEDLNIALLKVLESGLAHKLQDTVPKPRQGMNKDKSNGKTAVPFSQIKFLVYVIIACAATSGLMLGLEICWVKMKVWVDLKHKHGLDLF